MGFLPPAIAAIGSALSAGAAAVGTGLAAIGGGSAVAGAATAASLAIGAKSILAGGPKATTSAPAPAKPIAPAIPNAITPVNTGGLNKSLAALSPGLALGGTAGYLGASNNKGGKTLLGQ